MKITKKQLKRIIKEEIKRNKLLEENSGDPLQILEKVSAELIQDGTDMENWPSHTPASHVSSWVVEKGQQVKQALNMLDDEGGRNPGGSIGESLRERTMAPSGEFRGETEDPVAKLQNAVYALEDNILPALYGTELEAQANQLHKAIYAQIKASKK